MQAGGGAVAARAVGRGGFASDQVMSSK